MASPSEHRHIPSSLAGEITRLAAAGFSLLPTGGKDGKTALSKFAGRELSAREVLGRMRAEESETYGVRLGGLVVLDCDEQDQGLIAGLERRFGLAEVVVTTPRGAHLYYAHAGGVLPNLKAEGLPVDVKSGPNAYVLGPGSRRPDGGEYHCRRGQLSSTPLGELALDTGKGTADPSHGKIPVGSRNEYLFRRALCYAERVDDLTELQENLLFDRDEIAPGLRDTEVLKIARSAWGYRLRNRLWAGRKNSMARIHRSAIDQLRSKSANALALFVVLQSEHGHQPAKRFALDHAAMRRAGLTTLGRQAFRDARDTLLTEGLLERVSGSVPGRKRAEYRLSEPLAERPNVFPIRR